MTDESALLRTAFDGLGDQVAVLERSGVIVAVNAAWTRFGRENGAPVDDGYLGADYLDVCRAAAAAGVAGAGACHEGLRAVLARERDRFEFEYPCHAPGRERWFEMRAAPLATPEGHVVVTHHDITARRLSERDARHALELQSALLAVANRLLTHEVSREAYGAVLEQVIALIPSARSGSVLVRRSDGRFGFAAGSGFDWERLRRVSVTDAELHPAHRRVPAQASYTVRSRGPIDLARLDAARLGALRSAGALPGIASTLGVPIRVDGEIVALLTLAGPESGHAFSERDRRVGEAFGAQVGLVFRHLRAREAQRESEAEFRTMFSISSVGMAQCDVATRRFLRVNEALRTLTGYARDELLEMTEDDLTHPEDRVPDRERYLGFTRGTTDYAVEKRYRRKDGSVMWVRVTCDVIREDGPRPARAMAVIQDISERKRYEDQLSQAIQEVLADASWFGRAVMERLVAIRSGEEGAASLADLTPREREVLGLLAQGFGNEEIAARLGIGRATVRNYVSRIYGKLGVRTRAEAVVWARERGVVLQG